jgi:hypothetical protein
VSALSLRGFCLPGPTLPTFVIPYFGSATSNSIYVQELDSQHHVTCFLLFEPAHFTDYMGPIPIAEQDIGSEGLVGFVNREGKLVAGTADEIRRILADYTFATDGSDAFFATEVMEFRGDRSGLERAIASAAKRFSAPERGIQWQARELATHLLSPPASSTRATERGILLHDLRNSLREPMWVARFVEAWDFIGSDREFGDLALDWLNAGGSDQAEAGRLFNTLLTPSKYDRASRRKFENPPIYVIELARRWLEEMAYPASGWASLWHKLRRRNQIDRDLSNQLGARFLSVEPLEREKRKHSSSANGWMRVWRTLWIENAERGMLVDHLRRYPELATLGEFYKILELLSALPEYDEVARAYLKSWLEKAPRHLPSWPRVCLDVIMRYEDRHYFIDLALEWLRNAGAGFHTWYGLWSGLRPYIGDFLFAELGREWLQQGHITMRIWPEVLADLIEMAAIQSDEVFRRFAHQWLQLGKHNPRRTEIEYFTNRSTSYSRRVTSGPRLFLSYHFDADYWRVTQIRNVLVAEGGVRSQSVLASPTWEALKKEGHLAVETFVENQLRAASITLVLFSSETASREWVRYEVMRSHQLGLGLIAIDIHRLRDAEGQTARPGLNPLSLWQVDIVGETRTFSDIYPTYDWVADDGPRNIMRWIAEQMPHDHPAVSGVKLLD